MGAGKVHYGVARVDLHLPGVDNLKGKRAILNRLKAGLRDELDCSVAEVGEQDRWQRSVIGVAVAASSHTGVERVLDRLTAVIERDPRIVVLRTSELDDTLDDDGPAGWPLPTG
jgi:uncharacterized protein